MPDQYLFRFSLNGQFHGGTISWTPNQATPIVFFASLLEKIEQLKKRTYPGGLSKPLKIILADDDDDDRQLFEEAIGCIDPEIIVSMAQNGMELIEMMKSGLQPEIIFLDLNMPGKTGKECLTELRQHEAWTKIPVIIYSTSSNKKDILDTYSGGANLYLLKPPSFRELIAIIRQAFSFDWENTDRLPHKDFVLTFNS